jgi:hypothetical protein
MVSSNLLTGCPIDPLPQGAYCRICLGIHLLSILLTGSLKFCLWLPLYSDTGSVLNSLITSSFHLWSHLYFVIVDLN